MLETNNKETSDTLEDPYLQYVIFCSRFMEEHGHASVVGMLDAVDVSGTIKRGQPSPPENVSYNDGNRHHCPSRHI